MGKRGRAVGGIVMMAMVAGCAMSNVEWAMREGLRYEVRVVKAEKWPGWVPAGVACYVQPGGGMPVIAIREGAAAEFCLEHEVGHLREWAEGKPMHSTHAWDWPAVKEGMMGGPWGLR